MMLISSINPSFIFKLDFLVKLKYFENNFEKYEIRLHPKKLDEAPIQVIPIEVI